MKNSRHLALAFLQLLLVPLAPDSAHADDAPPRQVHVGGHCVRSVLPDRGSVTVTVSVLDRDLKAASRQASLTYERLKQAIEKLPLADPALTTSEYSVREERSWEKDKQVPKGFRARLGLRVVTSSIDKLGEVLALAAREGVQDVGGLQTFLSDEKRLKEQMECLRQAAENARAKADKLAVSLGARVAEVLSIREQGVGGLPGPAPLAASMMALEDSAAARSMPVPSVVAGAQTLELDVWVTFALR